jgi:hypothetical protein
MDNTTRLKMLRELQLKNGLKDFATHHAFVQWQAKIAPFLNFNRFYHTNWIRLSGPASVPGLSAQGHAALLSQMENIIGQAITELEYDLATKPIPSAILLTDEQGVWWFFQHCTIKTRRWVVGSLIGLIVACVTSGYLAGRNHFVRQVIELWQSQEQTQK